MEQERHRPVPTRIPGPGMPRERTPRGLLVSLYVIEGLAIAAFLVLAIAVLAR